MDKYEQMKKSFPQVAEAYPDTFDPQRWLEFDVYTHAYTDKETQKSYMLPVTYVKASPNNGTQYRFHVLHPKMGDERVIEGIPEHAMLIAMDPNHYAWRRTLYLRDFDTHPSYFMEKLGMGEPDAVAMSMILYMLQERNT